MLYADGAIKLTNPLANGQANTYTVLEKRDLSFLALVFKDWCRRMPYAHCERQTPSTGRD